ncbi:PLP-dependent transferase [Armillaria gallica]|uniref:Aspartate aminotransferase n=1 Tax=Armillaria gallica TaxID=47427 RepID=A0A2H3D3B0_ARMGA|nr:PLP-dependent transferase [Armillaria gallica]
MAEDEIFEMTDTFKRDPFPKKVNLGAGAYRDEEGKPWVLPAVKKAHALLIDSPTLDHEYLPITGLDEFTCSAAKLMFAEESDVIKNGRVMSIQTISGTGANHLGAFFLSRFYQFNDEREVYISRPTWMNHHAIFSNVGITLVEYPYYNAKTRAIDFDGMLSTMKSAPSRSIFVLHACAHNPTGLDPSQEQWTAIADIMLAKGHYAFFDAAYQGFATGDLDNDAWAVREFSRRGTAMLVCQSFAKNAGLYGERVGALHIVGKDEDTAKNIKSQLSLLTRVEFSTPPAYGAKLVNLILNDASLYEEWKRNIRTMAGRLIEVRKELHRLLTEELKTPGNWDHVVNQIGMFRYHPLEHFFWITEAQSKRLIDEYHIYLAKNGRISLAGLNAKNIKYFAESLDEVAEGIMSAIAEVIDESIRNMTSNMVTKADQEKQHYTQQVDFAQLKSELQLMEKNDLAIIKAENDRLLNDIEKLKQRLREEITRTQAGVRLDLNLEKGRLREDSAGQVLKIREVDTRIEQEIAGLRTAIQASKATTLQYIVGVVTTCTALLMAYLRFRA